MALILCCMIYTHINGLSNMLHIELDMLLIRLTSNKLTLNVNRLNFVHIRLN